MVKHSPSTSLQFCPRLPWNSELTESSSVLTTSILSNIWYRGKGRCGWEGKVNISIVLTDLFCNETELYPGHILIWYNPGIGKSQLPHVNEFMGTLLVCVLTQSCLTLFNSMDRQTAAPQVPLSTGFSRQEYTGAGRHFLLQGIFPKQGQNP